MDRYDFYFEQLVTQADMDGAFDFAEAADQSIQADNGYTGIVQGLEVVEATPTPNLTVTVGNGVAYDQTGQRCFVAVDQVLDVSQDSSAVPTAVANPGNEKWISIFVAFDRALSDPRVDGNGVPLQYLRAESFQFIVDQGAENAAGTAAVYTSGNAETYALVNGQTLDISIDGQAPQTVTFVTGDFVSIAAATAAEVAAVITAQVTGATAADNGGNVEITSASTGPGASLLATGGSALAAFGFPGVPAVGGGGPTRPALRPDALLLADVLLRFNTTQVTDKPDQGGTFGVIDTTTRRQTVFEYNSNFSIKAGTITEFADALSDILDTHIANTGNAHPASAITFDGSLLPGVWANTVIAPDVRNAFLALTQDLADQSATDGAALIGYGLTGTDLGPATVQFNLAALDALKGSLGNPNTWTAINDFDARLDANAGAIITEDLLLQDATLRHIPEDFNGNNDWTFGAGIGVSPIRKYGRNQQHVLGAGVTTSQTLLYTGGAAPAATFCGNIRGRVTYWDDNSNPCDLTAYDFSVTFALSAGVAQTVVFDEQFSAARLVNGGADDNISITIVAGAGTGELFLSIGWGANAGLVKNIATVWELELFSSNQ